MTDLWREHLLADGHLIGALGWVRAFGQTEVQTESIVFHPEGARVVVDVIQVLHLPERGSVEEYHASAEEELVYLLRVPVHSPLPVAAGDVTCKKRLVSPEHVWRQVGHPSPCSTRQNWAREISCAGFDLGHPGVRSSHADHFSGGGLIGDHAIGAISPSCRSHTFSIDALVDDHLLSRAQHCRGGADRPEGPIRGPRVGV